MLTRRMTTYDIMNDACDGIFHHLYPKITVDIGIKRYKPVNLRRRSLAPPRHKRYHFFVRPPHATAHLRACMCVISQVLCRLGTPRGSDRRRLGGRILAAPFCDTTRSAESDLESDAFDARARCRLCCWKWCSHWEAKVPGN